MSDITLNDDGTITVPLAAKRTDVDGKRVLEARDPVVLPEPTMGELAQIQALVREADEKLPPIPVPPADAPREVRDAFGEQLLDRTNAIFNADGPHAAAFLSIVELLSGTRYTLDDFPGRFMTPATLNRILTHFQAPLPGPDTVPGAPPLPVPAPLPDETESLTQDAP